MLRMGGWLDTPPARPGDNVVPGAGNATRGAPEIETGGGGSDRGGVDPPSP